MDLSPHDEQVALDPVRSAFETAVELLEAGRASLLLRETGQPVLVVAASVGMDSRLASTIRVPIGHGIAGFVAEQAHSLLGLLDHQSFLSVPVVSDEGIEGVLNVTDRRGDRAYMVTDIDLARKAAAHIGRLIQYGRYAARDPVSGLHNRRAFDDLLERELARSQRTGEAFTVAFLDLDGLKFINDQYGHNKGDEVIRSVGDTIRHILRPYDFAGRYGGDEFVLLLSGIGGTDVDAAAGGIVTRIEDALNDLAKRIRLPISTSIGVASWPVDGPSAARVVAIADARMYTHKRQKKASAERA